MFRGTDIVYTVEGTNILLTRRPAAPQSRAVSVTGRVTDAKGQPIIGASVIVRGTTLGVSTDVDGRFRWRCPPRRPRRPSR